MTEREVKLLVQSVPEARAAIIAAGAAPLKCRRLQEDALFDTDDETLRRRGCALRIRNDSGRSLLTFKGPVQPGPMKTREEHETVISDGDVLTYVLESLGLHVWFRYQKFREEFAAEDATIALDETPIGTFIEIEGGERAILALAPPAKPLDGGDVFVVLARRDGHVDHPLEPLRQRQELVVLRGAEVRDTPSGTQLGTHLIVPLERVAGPAILVDRGWVPFSGSRAQLPPARRPHRSRRGPRCEPALAAPALSQDLISRCPPARRCAGRCGRPAAPRAWDATAAPDGSARRCAPACR